MHEADDRNIEAELRGKTLRVYWYFVRHNDRTVGVREVQRALGLSSPSVASHHLEKLRALKLLGKTQSGEYYVFREVKVGFLKLFTRLGRLMLPRYIFYAVLVTTMLGVYVALYPQTFTIHNLMALSFGLIVSIIFWYETVRIMKEAPF